MRQQVDVQSGQLQHLHDEVLAPFRNLRGEELENAVQKLSKEELDKLSEACNYTSEVRRKQGSARSTGDDAGHKHERERVKALAKLVSATLISSDIERGSSVGQVKSSLAVGRGNAVQNSSAPNRDDPFFAPPVAPSAPALFGAWAARARATSHSTESKVLPPQAAGTTKGPASSDSQGEWNEVRGRRRGRRGGDRRELS